MHKTYRGGGGSRRANRGQLLSQLHTRRHLNFPQHAGKDIDYIRVGNHNLTWPQSVPPSKIRTETKEQAKTRAALRQEARNDLRAEAITAEDLYHQGFRANGVGPTMETFGKRQQTRAKDRRAIKDWAHTSYLHQRRRQKEDLRLRRETRRARERLERSESRAR